MPRGGVLSPDASGLSAAHLAAPSISRALVLVYCGGSPGHKSASLFRRLFVARRSNDPSFRAPRSSIRRKILRGFTTRASAAVQLGYRNPAVATGRGGPVSMVARRKRSRTSSRAGSAWVASACAKRTGGIASKGARAA